MTGWTFDEIDSMPFPEVNSLLDYWNENPPLHLMVKWYLGIKSVNKRKLNQYEQAALAQGQVIPFAQVPDYVKEAMKQNARQ